MARYAFISRHGSCTYIAATHEERGGNLPRVIDGNPVAWVRIEPSQAEAFFLISTPELERDLNETGFHITETRPKRLHPQV
jgi:hypothetical protein